MTGITDILGLGGKILDKVVPDPQAREQAKLELLRLQQRGDLAGLQAESDLAKAQLEVDKTEAASPSLFVAGWRPFIGWVCGMGLGYQFLLRPMATAIFGGAWVELDTSSLQTLLMGMLGLGGLRTFEKLNGVAR